MKKFLAILAMLALTSTTVVAAQKPGTFTTGDKTFLLNGKECKFRSPLDAEHAGISTVYQEVNLL